MSCREVTTVFLDVHTKHTSKFCEQNATILNVKPCGTQVTARRQKAKKF